MIEKSAGAVIFNGNDFLLLKYGWGHWGFVKGHIEEGENEIEAFLREAEEETGIKREELHIIDGFREKTSYFYKMEGKTIFKEVVYFVAECLKREIKLSFEHTDYAWLPFEEALKRITYEGDKKILIKAYDFLKAKGKM